MIVHYLFFYKTCQAARTRFRASIGSKSVVRVRRICSSRRYPVVDSVPIPAMTMATPSH